MEKTFILLSPITKEDGTKISEMVLKEPTAGQIEMAETQAAGKPAAGNLMNITLIGLCSGTHPQIIRNLVARDYRAITVWLEGFLEAAPTTGSSL